MVSFTMCLKSGAFTNAAVIQTCMEILTDVSRENKCIVPAYCFMPDHQHTIIYGQDEASDTWAVASLYKQKTGYAFSQHSYNCVWQKDFYDHIIEKEKDYKNQIWYVLNNPVRKGLVKRWEEYPFVGSINCDVNEFLQGMV